MKRIHRTGMLFLVCLLTCTSFITANAYPARGWRGDPTSGFDFTQSALKTRFTTYRYAPFNGSEAKLKAYVDYAITQWETKANLVFTKTNLSPNIIMVATSPLDEDQTTEFKTHAMTSAPGTPVWSIVFYPSFFSENPEQGQLNFRRYVVMHELGHIFGLNEFNDYDNIMRQGKNTSPYITEKNVWGMKIATYQYLPGASVDYNRYLLSYHKKRDTSSLAYQLENHSYVKGVCSKCRDYNLGWVYTGGNWKYLEKYYGSYTWKTNEWLQDDGKWFYFDSSGNMVQREAQSII